MAQRSNRRGKGKVKKQPELRSGGGRKAKAERSQARQADAERSTLAGPVLRMRPSGVLGYLFVLAIASLAIAGIAAVGLRLDRWNLVSYPDSLWLYVAFGAFAVSPAVGRVSRSERDADGWGVLALAVPCALYVYELVTGPACPTGAQCGAIGARGSLGTFWSILVIVLLALAAWGIARWQHRSAAAKRPQHGRVRYRVAGMTMLGLLLFPGLGSAAALVGVDLWLRDTPSLVDEARGEVERECYGLDSAPALDVRAAPSGYNPGWTTFAVRRANESRPGVGKKSLPSNWATLDYVYPYEATVSFSENGEPVTVTCRKVGPGSGNAVADDLTPPTVESNPLSPKTTGSEFLPRFFTQGVAGPTEEATKKAAEEAKAAATKEKADAAKAKADDAKPDTDDAKADDAK